MVHFLKLIFFAVPMLTFFIFGIIPILPSYNSGLFNTIIPVSIIGIFSGILSLILNYSEDDKI